MRSCYHLTLSTPHDIDLIKYVYFSTKILYRCNERTRCGLPILRPHDSKTIFNILTLFPFTLRKLSLKVIPVYSSFLRHFLYVCYLTLFFCFRQPICLMNFNELISIHPSKTFFLHNRQFLTIIFTLQNRKDPQMPYLRQYTIPKLVWRLD